MRLFIDATVFLSFYEYTNETLTELNKLCVLIESKRIELLLPQQVVDETWRRRSGVLSSSFAQFKERVQLPFPSYCRNQGRYTSVQAALDNLRDSHRQMIDDVREAISRDELGADRLLKQLFGLANQLERTPQLMAAARERVELGNPPGKRGSIGDAVNWEALMAAVPRREPLFFISGDSDFASPLSKELPNEFLRHEWTQRKESELHFYTTLSRFFESHEQFKGIDLERESEKARLIQELARSPNFSMTHALIARLSTFEDFTSEQVAELVEILLTNRQVHWILEDRDVSQFYRAIARTDEYGRYVESRGQDPLGEALANGGV